MLAHVLKLRTQETKTELLPRLWGHLGLAWDTHQGPFYNSSNKCRVGMSLSGRERTWHMQYPRVDLPHSKQARKQTALENTKEKH